MLDISSSTISDNVASLDGGGILQSGDGISPGFHGQAGNLTLSNSTLSGNNAGRSGGGIAQFSRPYTVTNPQQGGTLTLSNSTISGNRAGGFGGGIYGKHSVRIVNDSTIIGNTAGQDGGGMQATYGRTSMFRSIVSGNTATRGQETSIFTRPNTTDTCRLYLNLVGHNGLTRSPLAFNGCVPGGLNIIATSDGNLPTPLGNILNPTLSFNGGPTKTHALPLNSPALDASNADAPDTDQRGVMRPRDGNGDGTAREDIGAFELGRNRVDVSVDLEGPAGPVALGSELNYTFTVSNTGPDPASGLLALLFLPAGVSFVSSDANSEDCTHESDGGVSTLTCYFSTLEVGDDRVMHIASRATAPGDFTVSASVSRSSIDLDANPGNEEDQITTRVEPPPPVDLAIALADRPDPAVVNQPITYSATISNLSPTEAATGVIVRFNYPPNVIRTSAPVFTDATGTCMNQPNDEVACTLQGPLAPGAAFGIDFVAQSASPQTLSASVQVDGDAADSDTANNDATESTVVTAAARLFSIDDAQIVEGNAGTKVLTFNVRLSAPASAALQVRATTADSTASAGSDYVAKNVLVRFASGESVKPFAVTVKGDRTAEPDETFVVNLSAPTGGAVIGDGQATGTIVNDDSVGQPTISINDVSVNEGRAGVKTTAGFTVTLSRMSTDTVTVRYATANGSATAPSDYVAKSGTLSFAPGQRSKPVAITVKGNATPEPDESFSVDLSAPVNVLMGDSHGDGTIELAPFVCTAGLNL